MIMFLIILIVVLVVVMLVMSLNRKKKDDENRKMLNEQIVKGAHVKNMSPAIKIYELLFHRKFGFETHLAVSAFHADPASVRLGYGLGDGKS